MRILFAVINQGLGHATRSWPLIDALLRRKHKVYVASSGRALAFLENEFGSKIAEYFDVPGYSYQDRAFTEKKFNVLGYILDIPKYLREIRLETEKTKVLHSKYNFDCIVSDSRYGTYSPDVPSYLIHSHIRMTPGRTGIVGRLLCELGTKYLMRNYDMLLIPDNQEDGVGGELTHGMRLIRKDKYVHLGILSMIRKKPVKQDVDYFFSISGPEPQRTVLEKKILSCIAKLEGKTLVSLGKPEISRVIKKGNAKIYGYMGRKKQEEALNRAKLVITRSGYSTVMDVAELGKPALFIPTRGQPEQEYLAAYHDRLKHHMKRDLAELDLVRDLKKAGHYKGHDCKPKTNEAVRKFLEVTNL